MAVEFTPEERERVYQEELARRAARKRIWHQEYGLTANLLALLLAVFLAWETGIIDRFLDSLSYIWRWLKIILR
jgi:hypothetical protein